MGHEMGHFALGHVTRSILLSSLVVLVCLFVVDRAGAGSSAFFPHVRLRDACRRGLAPPAHPAARVDRPGPLSLVMAYSRAQEHEADVFALELTQTNHSAASAFAKLQQENLGVPWHGIVEKLWRSTHPSIGERIEFCNIYHPWTDGRPLVFGATSGPVRRPVGLLKNDAKPYFQNRSAQIKGARVGAWLAFNRAPLCKRCLSKDRQTAIVVSKMLVVPACLLVCGSRSPCPTRLDLARKPPPNPRPHLQGSSGSPLQTPHCLMVTRGRGEPDR